RRPARRCPHARACRRRDQAGQGRPLARAAYFFLPELLLLELLRLALLLELELELFLEPLELEPDLVGMTLSFRRYTTHEAHVLFLRRSAQLYLFPYCSPRTNAIRKPHQAGLGRRCVSGMTLALKRE